MVGRQPFGGNRLSGTGTKAGGPDYLLHFVEPHVVTENTVRHGLVDLATPVRTISRNARCSRSSSPQLGVERDGEEPPWRAATG